MVLNLGVPLKSPGSLQCAARFERTTCVETSRGFTEEASPKLHESPHDVLSSQRGSQDTRPGLPVFLLCSVAILEKAGFLAQMQPLLPDSPVKITDLQDLDSYLVSG